MNRQVAATAHQVLCAGLGWLQRHRPTMPATGHDLDDSVLHYKPLGEIALCASLVHREAVTGTDQTRQAEELNDHVWTQLRHGDLARPDPATVGHRSAPMRRAWGLICGRGRRAHRRVGDPIGFPSVMTKSWRRSAM